MKITKFTFILSICFASLLHGYEVEDPTLGNIALEAGVWKTTLGGQINNTTSSTDFKDDLGFDKDKAITTVGIDLKNDYSWLPNIYVNYFVLNSSVDSRSDINKTISTQLFERKKSSALEYSELNSILYGYFAQSIFEFDVGLNFKKIDYKQSIKQIDNPSRNITITGPKNIIPLPYFAIKIDLYPINTVLKAETSMLSIGDDEAKDYSYSINYRAMKNMYISYGYKYNSWKTTNKDNIHEKYDMHLKGNYINAKILF